MTLNHNSLSRRTFLSTASLFAACSRRRAQRYRAWLFVASAAEKALVVSDLASFRRSGTIPLGVVPDQVLSALGKVFAVCNANQTVARVDPVQRAITARIPVGGKVAAATLTTAGKYLAIALGQPPSVLLIDTNNNRIVHRTNLPEPPRAIAASEEQLAVVLLSGKLARVHIGDGELLGLSAIDAGSLSAIAYRKDGQTIFVAAPDAQQIISVNAESGSVLARLPVPIRPVRFCVDGTGGQVFVTGADQEARLVIFSPYQNQVDQTLYAGHALFGMAVAPVRNLLFVSNPDAGDVTILNIDTRRIAASIRTGGHPREILIASSAKEEEYAFVVDGDSGDVSVIHIPVVLHRSGDAFIAEPPKPVFAVFRGGAGPQSAVIVPYES